jgi:hypothetical protein
MLMMELRALVRVVVAHGVELLGVVVMATSVEVSTVNYGEAVIAQSFSLTRDTMISQTT